MVNGDDEVELDLTEKTDDRKSLNDTFEVTGNEVFPTKLLHHDKTLLMGAVKKGYVLAFASSKLRVNEEINTNVVWKLDSLNKLYPLKYNEKEFKISSVELKSFAIGFVDGKIENLFSVTVEAIKQNFELSYNSFKK